MALTPGTRLGVFEITGLLGKGGMGEVYRARDSKLGREVAIKVLPEDFAKDPDRLARFEREAQMLAALDHPNIAALYDFQTGRASVPASREDAGENAAREYARPPGTDAPEIHFLVMQLVEGETLAVRLERGPMPVDEALPIFAQIAGALEAAHDRGIVHRDLKPANIKLAPDDRVKVLDFGIAKSIAPSGPGLRGAGTATLSSPNASTVATPPNASTPSPAPSAPPTPPNPNTKSN